MSTTKPQFKVLHLTISSEIGGGPEHIFQLIQGLSLNIESHIACPSQGHYFEKFIYVTSNRVVLLPHRKFSIVSLINVINYIKLNNIDLLHSHGKGAGFYCRLINLFVKIPSIHTPHGINKKIEVGILNKFYLWFERFFSKYIRAVIFVSKTELEYEQKLKIWPHSTKRIINNGTSLYSHSYIRNLKNRVKKKFNWETKSVIITASRFDYQKNTIEFLRIAAKLPELIFVILGDGLEKEYCIQFCEDENISNVFFLGNVLNPLEYFAASDIYLSTARWEGLSIAILEAMSVGLPIVATKVTGNVDLVIHLDNGCLYEIGDVDQAKIYLLNILETKNYFSFSNASYTHHKSNFSSLKMCDSTLELYNNILHN